MNRYIRLLFSTLLVMLSTHLDGSQATAAASADAKTAAAAKADAKDSKKSAADLKQQLADLKVKQDIAHAYTKEIEFLKEFFGNDMMVKPDFLKFLMGAPDLDLSAIYGPVKRTMLMGLVALNNNNLVTRYMQRKPHINQKDITHYTALNYAMRWCVDPQITYALIQADATIDHVHQYGLTPLMDCCNIDATRMLPVYAQNNRLNLQLLLTALRAKDTTLIDSTGLPGAPNRAINFAIGSLQDHAVTALLASNADFLCSSALSQARRRRDFIVQDNSIPAELKTNQEYRVKKIVTTLEQAHRDFDEEHIVEFHEIPQNPALLQWLNYFGRLEQMNIDGRDAAALRNQSENYSATVKALAALGHTGSEKLRARRKCVQLLRQHKELTAQAKAAGKTHEASAAQSDAKKN